MKLVWRGGRAFKSTQGSTAAAQKANGTGNAVISLDSDDEGDSGKAFEDKPEFEDEEEEFDPSQVIPKHPARAGSILRNRRAAPHSFARSSLES